MIPGPKTTVEAAMLQCSGDGVENNVSYDILDFDFFDDDSLVIVFRADGAEGACSTAQRLSTRLVQS
jgi:hypothetical protein